jgi:phytanoyl-CoA hydroxylase
MDVPGVRLFDEELKLMKPSDKFDYGANGYHISPGLVPDEVLEQLIVEAEAICCGHRGPVDGLPDRANYPQESSVLNRILAIHFPHKVSPKYTDFLSYPPVVEILEQFIGPNVKCMQSLLFIKPPGMPGQAWHQDEIPIPTRDRSLTGVWVALDDATIDNGCLWVIPGSHKPGILYERHPHDDPRFDKTPQARDIPYNESEAVPVEITRGSVLFFNGYLLHRSLNNVSADQSRRSLVMHYMSAESYLPWRGVEDYRDIVMVRGQDPYEHRGLVDESRAFVRNSGVA